MYVSVRNDQTEGNSPRYHGGEDDEYNGSRKRCCVDASAVDNVAVWACLGGIPGWRHKPAVGLRIPIAFDLVASIFRRCGQQ